MLLAVLGVSASVFLAVAGFGSWCAAKKSSETASTLKEIERSRRHDELAPTFAITFTRQQGSQDRIYMQISLAGGGSDVLEEVVITILNDARQDHWGHGLPAGVTQEQADEFVWGPWEFDTEAYEQVANRRTTRPRIYSRLSGQNWERLAMIRTRPGFWMEGPTQNVWERDNPDPIRLLFKCIRADYDPWQVLMEVYPEKALDHEAT
jgi:hypothetical protein